MPIYDVLADGWLTNAHGHGAYYEAAKKGRKPVTIEMTDDQARYLLASEQIGVAGSGAADAPEPAGKGEPTEPPVAPPSEGAMTLAAGPGGAGGPAGGKRARP